MTERKLPTPSAMREATRNPNGRVLEVANGWGLTKGQSIPPGAIKGHWMVDAQGQIVGEFVANPAFDPANVPRPPIPPTSGSGPPPFVVKRS